MSTCLREAPSDRTTLLNNVSVPQSGSKVQPDAIWSLVVPEASLNLLSLWGSFSALHSLI